MNIDEMTLGELKEIKAILSGGERDPKPLGTPAISAHAIGSYVLVRSRNEGINAGVLKQADETGCVLAEARRIWYHKPKATGLAWYEGVAESGLHQDSKVSCAVREKIIIEDYSLTLCTDEARKSIANHPSHEG